MGLMSEWERLPGGELRLVRVVLDGQEVPLERVLRTGRYGVRVMSDERVAAAGQRELFEEGDKG